MVNTEKVLKARVIAVDNYTAPMRRAIEQSKTLQKVSKAIKPIILKAKDMASRVLSPVKSKIDQIKAIPQVQTLLKAVDMASKVIGTVFNGLKRIGGMVVSATVKVMDKASSILSGIMGKMSALAGGVTIGVALKTGFNALGEEQTQKITISNVIENSGKSKEEAKKVTDAYYKELEAFSNATPFSVSEVAGFGVKAMQMAKGDVEKAMDYTKAQGSVKALVGDMRTAQEVSEAFFSASNGNMDSINNILGEQYSSFDELIKGVNTKQKDVLADMSTTIPGLVSTIGGLLTTAMKGFVSVFGDPISNALKNITSFIETATPMLTSFGERLSNLDISGLFSSFDFTTVLTAIQPLTEFISSLFSQIETRSPAVQGWMDILGTVFNTVFTALGSVITAVMPTVESIFNFIGEHSVEIQSIVQGLGSIWSAVWSTVGVLLEAAWTIVKPILDSLLGLLGAVGDMVKAVGDWWTDMVNKIKNNPIVAKVSQVWEDVTSSGKPKSKRSAFGTNRVVGNDVPYRLHDGERVLTASESRQLDHNGLGNGVTITKLADTLIIREEADIDKIVRELANRITRSRLAFGGAY